MLHCPTREEIHPQALALLPRGDAWQSEEGGPLPDSTMSKYWLAVADVFEFLNRRICALYDEFFCLTHVETHDLWLADHGLPDPCDPYQDLCEKVRAIGGARCEDYAEAALRAGWSIECITEQICGARAGCARAGRARVGGPPPAGVLRIRVHLDDSPSFSGPSRAPALSGRMRAGRRLTCPPDISPLVCLLERIVHAHLIIIYEVV